MENIPTAEEFLIRRGCQRMDCDGEEACDFFEDVQPGDIIEFAKLHVEAALKAASDNAKIHSERIVTLGGTRYEDSVDKKSILNSYPPENIK